MVAQLRRQQTRPYVLAVDRARARCPAAKLYRLAVDGKKSCDLTIACAMPQHLAAWLQGITVDRARPHDLAFDCLGLQYPAAKSYHLPFHDQRPRGLAIAYESPQHLATWSHGLVIDRHGNTAPPSTAQG